MRFHHRRKPRVHLFQRLDQTGENALGNTLKCSMLFNCNKVQQVGVHEFFNFLLPYGTPSITLQIKAREKEKK